jgi:hypothetical protein
VDDETGEGGSFAWTPDTYAGVGVNATSTGLWLKATSPFSLVASSTFATNASSTQFTNTGSTWLPSLTSALIVTGSDGLLAEYAGDTCTNQLVEDIDAAGNTTCVTVDANYIDEASIEGAIDTLANLTSIQSLTVTLADAGADAILGWDDTAGAYENLTAAEALAIIGGAANDFDANGDVTIAIADISDLGANVGTWLGTPSSANLASAVTGETGTGALVFGTSPSFTTGFTTPQAIFSGGTTDVTTVSNEHFNISPNGTGRVGIASSTPMSLFGVAGTTTAQTLNIDNPNHTGTSTLYIYSSTSGFGGEIILEDSDGAGCTSITTLNGNVSGITVTCPTAPVAN